VTGVFAQWQPVYADHGIATFPVNDNKVPAVRNYGRIGINASSSLASRFGSGALGFMCGCRSGITVLDVDTADERVLADAIDRHGKTSIVARSGSGHFQAWYRHAGERRLIRPRRDVPIDILGGGFVVAPPSRVAKGSYQFIQGSLDDLESLPTLNEAPRLQPASELLATCPANVKQGERNKRLFEICLHAARYCDDFESLCDAAMTRNSEFSPPMGDDEVMKVATSAWRYETEGRNYSGGMRAVFSESDVMPLMSDPYVGMLIVWAKARFKPDGHFWIADGLAAKFGWSRNTFKQVRKRAVEIGEFRLIAPAGFKRPAIYGWGLRALSKQGKVSVEN
jgi:hypothetical protein